MSRKRLRLKELREIWEKYSYILDHQITVSTNVSREGLYFPGYFYNEEVVGVVELKSLLHNKDPSLIWDTSR